MTAIAHILPRARGRIATLFLALAILLVALPALAAPTFPKLTGRVVDDAGILSPATEQALTQKLEALETSTGRQLVVATVPSLQGYEIEDYGYQLGRTWGLGAKDRDDGALLIVAPNDRKVRIEVGYGLEPVLTDAVSSVIIQSAILPKFRDGDMEGGVVAGTDAIAQQLSLPDDQAKAVVAKAAEKKGESRSGGASIPFIILFVVFWIVVSALRGRRGGGNAAAAILGGILGASLGRDHDDWGGGGGGGWGGGGGGFSGGGGSFGGGGSSGSW